MEDSRGAIGIPFGIFTMGMKYTDSKKLTAAVRELAEKAHERNPLFTADEYFNAYAEALSVQRKVVRASL